MAISLYTCQGGSLLLTYIPDGFLAFESQILTSGRKNKVEIKA